MLLKPLRRGSAANTRQDQVSCKTLAHLCTHVCMRARTHTHTHTHERPDSTDPGIQEHLSNTTSLKTPVLSSLKC